MALSSTMDMGMRSNNGGDNDFNELKTQFMTREGIYRLMTLSEYSRPNRVGYANSAQGTTAVSAGGGGAGSAGGGGATGGCSGGGPVKVSFVSLPKPNPEATLENNVETLERITFNYGREIFVYPYRGVRKAADLTKPIDKRIYKGTFPTCHDFGPVNDDAEIVPLVVGFSGGQIQLVDPIRKELSKLFNEEVRFNI